MFWIIVGLVVVVAIVVAWAFDRRRKSHLKAIALNDAQDARSGAYRGPLPRDFNAGGGGTP